MKRLHTAANLALKNPFVKVGQIWADNDPRCLGREIRIVALGFQDETGLPTKAAVVARRGKESPWSSNIRNILVRRFLNRSNGYKLVYHPAR